MEDLACRLELYEMIFESINHGVMITDAEGYITFFNKPYGKFLGLRPEEQIGKHVTEVIENTRMHIVAKTGKPEINQSQRIQGQNMVVQRIPILKDGKVVAVFGQVMFKDVQDVGKLARQLSLLESKVEFYEQELLTLRSTRYTLDSIIGVSEQITALKEEALKAAATAFPVLILGESGTGKELFAQAIHHASPRRLYPFVRINCAAIPKDLLESELFGYEKGAFTGAKSGGKPGKFELARRGTVFLDEVGDLPLEMQPKLLRVLEEKEFERIGGTRVIKADFRLISASNQNLEDIMEKGGFRNDFFYRLNVIPLHIPPLRERPDDILPLARHLLRQIAENSPVPDIALTRAAETALTAYPWPGNVRELLNILERTWSSVQGHAIRVNDLPFHIRKSKKGGARKGKRTLKTLQAENEKEAILDALEQTGYNKAQAARSLGIHRTLLYKKIRRLGLPLKGATPQTPPNPSS